MTKSNSFATMRMNEGHMKDLLDVIGWQRSEIWDLEKVGHESE